MAVTLPAGVSADTVRAVYEALTQGIAIDGDVSNAAIGAVGDDAYTDDTGAADGTVIALLKGCFVQLAQIAENTTPAG